MKTPVRKMLAQILAATLTVPVAFAQQPPVTQQQQQPAQPQFRQEQLDQMLAPIALYPDSLLSQILMAATYPLEVVEAARWARANPGLKGEDAVKAVEDRDWDPSVKSLVAFPQVLTMMDERLDWTERLGEAFLGQQAQVMGSIQALREKAYAAGNLQSNDQMRVTRQGSAIVIDPPTPQVVYVPYYNPYVVYGGWWWPAYPPVYWPIPAVYYPRPAFMYGFAWGTGIALGTGFFYGAFNWPRRQVTNVVTVNNYYYTRNIYRPGVAPGAAALRGAPTVSNWQHDPAHRRGAPYRDASLASPHYAPAAGMAGSHPDTRRRTAGAANTANMAPAPMTRDDRASARGAFINPPPGQEGRRGYGSDGRGQTGAGSGYEPRMTSRPSGAPSPATQPPGASVPRAQPRVDNPEGFGRNPEGRGFEGRGDRGQGRVRDQRSDFRGPSPQPGFAMQTAGPRGYTAMPVAPQAAQFRSAPMPRPVMATPARQASYGGYGHYEGGYSARGGGGRHGR